MYLLDGEISANPLLHDRGLHYGDGLFETIAVRNGQLEFWHLHMRRLRNGCARLKMPAPDEQQLLSEARRLLDGRRDAVLKIIVTRGRGGRGYRAPDQTQPSRILALHDLPLYAHDNQADAIALRLCQTRLGLNPALAGIKHLNRLEQVLARSEWDDETIFEGVMLDINGHVIEGTMSNLFFVKDGTLHSADLSNAGVAGIMRDVILATAEELHLKPRIGHFTLADIESADELFISNALLGVRPVWRFEEQVYGAGAFTQQIGAAVQQARQKDPTHETV